ncbi:MAG: hypothetical protein QE283_12030 [Rhodoferax sp.]|nr:hypothetical protein [Rhodoferax sp.]
MTNGTTPKLGTPHAERHVAPYTQLRNLIASRRQRLAGAVNAELTRLCWAVGERLRTEVLGGADRAKSSREQVELLQMHQDGITVAAYWTELPTKAELEKKLQAALLEARERLARRGARLGT